MKAKHLFASAMILSLAFSASISRAADILAAGNGNWSSTVPNAPWPGGVVPGTNDNVEVNAPFNITVDSTAAIQYIFGSGTVTMAAGSTLNVVGDPAGAQGTYQLAVLDATAAGNSVIYTGNPFWAKQCNYFNLVMANTNYVDPFPPFIPWQNFNNFSGAGGPTPMTIGGNLTLTGKVKVQQGGGGAPITVVGNLTIGAGCAWDCSGDVLTVGGNTYVNGLMSDLNGALGTNHFAGSVIVSGPSTHIPSFAGGPYTNGWFVSDVITWGVDGNLTNNGAIFGAGYGSITFGGTGIIAGTNALTLPTLTINGTYTVGTRITLITNTPTLNGTLVFDLANTNSRVVLLTNATTALFYSGNLNVINSGAPPASGAQYQLFTSTNGYGGAFDSTVLPGLPGGLSWVDDLANSGSISVVGASGPVITSTTYNSVTHQFTLTWTSAAAETYSIEYTLTLAGGFNQVLATGIPSGGSTTTTTVTMPNGNTGFLRVKKP